jgi:E-phenylitaconyl-CoA hydratase
MSVVEYRVEDGIATVTLNRPERLNAMNDEMSGLLRARFREADKDPRVRVLIVAGAGERAFSSGMDLRGERGDPAGPQLLGEDEEEYAPWTLLKVRKPTIAAIHGYALAGGLDLALGCDLRIASDDARLGFPEVHWNLPDGFATYMLTRAVPLAHAMDLLLRAQRIDAQHALRIGLVNEVVPRERLLPRCQELAQELEAQGPLAIRAMKEMVYRGLFEGLEAVMAAQGKYMRLLRMTEDGEEGRRAFPERREPRYQGR